MAIKSPTIYSKEQSFISNRASLRFSLQVLDAELPMCRSPVIDGHIDLPEFARAVYGNNISKFDLRDTLVRLPISLLSLL